MRRILFILLFLAQAANAYAAIKTLKPAGVDKLDTWAQKVARIYGTALKNTSGATNTETLDIYIYAHAPGGFTTAGYVKASYSNSNMPAPAACLASLAPQTVPLTASCPGAMALNGSGKDYGAYDPAGSRGLMFQPLMDQNYNQLCLTQNYGFGACNGANLISSVRSTCVKGMRKYEYDVGPVPYCNIPNGATGWSALYYNVKAESLCLSNASRLASFAPVSLIPCSVGSEIAEIKQVLESYRNYILSCSNGLVSPELNTDLIELDAVLNEIATGVVLAAEDILGDTNPAPARNPWTFTNPTLAAEEPISQTHLVGNEVSEKFKVKIMNSDGSPANDQIEFSVGGTPPAADWSFVPGTSGQPVTRDPVSGIVEAGFKLGTTPGTYPIKATCAECCPGEVAFSATAQTLKQATALQKISGDVTGEARKILANPITVQAVNQVAGTGVVGLNVKFSVVSVPSGSMGSNIGPDSQTDSFGISAAAAALGSTAGTYVFRAECTDCERNKTVDFTINTVLPPDADSFSKEPPQSKVDQPSDPEHEIGALDVLFKSRNVFKRIDTSLVAGKPRQRIGVLRGDSVVFRAVSAPNAVSPSELVWSSDEPMGNGTGEEITVTFNSVGDISQTVQARNKSKTVKITVKDLSNVKHWDEFWDGRLLQKLKCGIFALKAAAAAKTLYGDTWRNGIGDAFRHSYWTALTANEYQDEAFGFSVTESYETKGLAHVNPRPLYPNETVMDLENDAVGAYYGAHTPKSTLESMLVIIAEITTSGELTVLDTLGENQNRQLTGLLEKHY